MNRCVQCTLPENFPGIQFDDRRLCNYCRGFSGVETLERKQEAYRERFAELLAEYRNTSDYDVLLCYSGGKDSTYTLSLLRRVYALKVLAVTFDNGFIPARTLTNIRNVVEKLDVDHVLFKPQFGLLQKIFRSCVEGDVYPLKMLERATAICTSCMALVKFSSLRLALDKDIPFVVFGWSPGQVPVTSALMKNNPDMVKLMQDAVLKPLRLIGGAEVLPYFLGEKYFSGVHRFPYNVSPLAFLKYSEEEIYREIGRLGWEAPAETDANSTNCLLNSFSNRQHMEKYGFHPYAFEIAGLIRKGAMSRAEGLDKLSRPEDPEVVASVRAKLGLAPPGEGSRQPA